MLQTPPGEQYLRIATRLLLVIVIFLTVAALRFAQPVIIALLLTVLLVYVMDPIVSFLQKRRFPLWLATFIAALLFTSFFLGLSLLLVRALPISARRSPGSRMRSSAAPKTRSTTWSAPWERTSR